MWNNQGKIIRLVLIGYVFFIIYGTLIPFNFSAEFWVRNIHAIEWVPFFRLDGSRASFPDLVQNVLFFLPFGFLASLVLPIKKSFWYILLIVLAGGLLSSAVEFLQLFTVDRTTSSTDILANMLGTALGCFAVTVAEPCVRRLSADVSLPRDVPSELVCTCFFALVLVIIGMLIPFDFTLDFGNFKAQVKLLLFSPPLPADFVPGDEGVVLLRFLLLSFTAARLLEAVRIPAALFKAFAGASVLGLVLELTQLFILSRGPSVTDMGVIVLGSMLGVFFAFFLDTGEKRRLGLWILLLGVIGAIIVQSMSPFRFHDERIPLNLFLFFPYYEKTTFVALANFMDSILMYIPLAFLLVLLFRGRNILLSILLPALLIAMPLEIAQGWVIGRYPDGTDVLGAVLGLITGSYAADFVLLLSHEEK